MVLCPTRRRCCVGVALPKAKDILADFLSGDSTRIHEAVGTVMALPDGDDLAALSAQVDAIEACCAQVDMKGALYPNRRHFEAAMKRLRLYARRHVEGPSRDNCYCRLFTEFGLKSPDSVALAKRVAIKRTRVNREAHSTFYLCECVACSANFSVVEQTGWHVPTYDWKEI